VPRQKEKGGEEAEIDRKIDREVSEKRGRTVKDGLKEETGLADFYKRRTDKRIDRQTG
jgi:hypothetical protein